MHLLTLKGMEDIMDPKIVIAVAPTGGWGRGQGNPLTPEDIAADVVACAEAGAAVAHLHARDLEGRLTADLTVFNQAVDLIKSNCDIVVEASTWENDWNKRSKRSRGIPTPVSRTVNRSVTD